MLHSCSAVSHNLVRPHKLSAWLGAEGSFGEWLLHWAVPLAAPPAASPEAGAPGTGVLSSRPHRSSELLGLVITAAF